MKRIYQERFQKVWQNFKRETDVQLYNPEWTRNSHGRKIGIALAVRITEPDVRYKIISIANEIRDIPGLYIFPAEYYHITVKVLGFMSDIKSKVDDIVPEEVSNLLCQVTLVTEEIPTFTLEIGAVNLLDSFIILEVEDEGKISLIQRAFREKASLVPSYELEGDNWLPHFSVAAFQSLEGLEELKTRLEGLRGKRVGEMEVKRIDLIEADLQKPLPELRVIHSYHLNAWNQKFWEST